MAKEKLITTTQLKKLLQDYTQRELISGRGYINYKKIGQVFCLSVVLNIL